jgi:hypothetical protein
VARRGRVRAARPPHPAGRTRGQAPRLARLRLPRPRPHHLRPLPEGVDLDALFLHRATRTVSKVGTVRWGGGRLEVSPELAERKVELRYDPNDPGKLPKVYVARRFVCDTVPLDLYRNAYRKRRRNLGAPDPAVVPTGLSPLDDLVREHQRLTAPLDHLAAKENDDDETDDE